MASLTYIVAKIGENRGTPRIWFEGRRVAAAGFKPGSRYTLVAGDDRLTLQLRDDGARIVSCRRRGDHSLPVIDLNNRDIKDVFSGLDAVRIVMQEGSIQILPLATEKQRLEREERTIDRLLSGESIRVGSLSHGGGVLSHALHDGMQAEGLEVELAFANDIREDLIDHASEHNDAWSKSTIAIAAPMQEVASDPWLLKKLPLVEILEAGLPCSGASLAGRAKRGLCMPEAHPEVGHLVHAFLKIIAAVNPSIVVLENVTSYASSASAFIIRHQLRDLGYQVLETELRGAEWGALEDRKRYCMVAVSRGIAMSLTALQPPSQVDRQSVGNILEAIADDDPRWSTMPGLKAKEIRDAAAGKGFRMSIAKASDTRIGTLTKGMAKNRSTDPKIQHPTNPDLLRIPTPVEHARAKSIPERLIASLSATIAHELLGQSITYTPFVALGRLIAQSLLQFSRAAMRPAAA